MEPRDELVVGRIYQRSWLHDRFGGNRQRGISAPKDRDFVLIFSGGSGEYYGYVDGWTDDRTFEYTGEGRRGDMTMTVGNKAILDRADNVFLFEILSNGVRFIGHMRCTGSVERAGKDETGKHRKLIIFRLTPTTE